MDIFCHRPRQEEPSTGSYQPSPRYVAYGDIQRKQPPTTRRAPVTHDDSSIGVSSWANMDMENPGGSSLLVPKGRLPTSDASIGLSSWANMDTDDPAASNFLVPKDRLCATNGALRYGGQTMISTKQFRGKALHRVNESTTNPKQEQLNAKLENDDQSVSMDSWANIDITRVVNTNAHRGDRLHQSDSVLQYNRPKDQYLPRHANSPQIGKLRTSKKKSRSQSLLDQAPSKPEVTASRSQSMDLTSMNHKGSPQALPPIPPTTRNVTRKKVEKRKMRIPSLIGRRWSTGHSQPIHQ